LYSTWSVISIMFYGWNRFSFVGFIWLFTTLTIYLVTRFNGSLQKLSAALALSVFLFFSISTVFDRAPNTPLTQNFDVLTHRTQVVEKDFNELSSSYGLTVTGKRQTVRPINFIESPLDHTSPKNFVIGTSAYQFCKYLCLLIKPWPMGFYYGYKEIEQHALSEPVIIFDIFIFLVLLLLAFYCTRSNPVISFGLFFMVLSILPYLVLATAIPGLFADRYSFHATIGFSLLLATAFVYLYHIPLNSFFAKYVAPEKIKQPLKIALTTLLLVYSALTIARNAQWKDNLTLFRHDIKHLDKSAQAHNILALNLMAHSDEEQNPLQQMELRKEALFHFKKVLEIYPSFFNGAYDIGRVYSSLNMPDSALAAFKHALTIDTSYSEVHRNIGEILSTQGKFAEAVPYFIHVINDQPTDYNGYDKLSFAYFKLNEFDKSLEVNKEAIRQMPLIVDPYVNIGRTYLGMQQSDSARYYFQKANEMFPGNPMVQQFLQQIGSR
jgi:tetratricopeptide (TPR) repeat protein